MIETERLILRPWRHDDLAAMTRINADPRVGNWLGGPISPKMTEEFIAIQDERRAELGYCFFAAERRTDAALLGAIGLIKPSDVLPRLAIEIGWRLDPSVHGEGYASEGARAVLDFCWDREAPEVVAITAVTNAASRKVMERIGMTREPDCDFDHPNLSHDHPLRRHVFYSIRNPR